MRLHGKNFQYCDAGGSLTAVPGVESEGISVNIEPQFVEKVLSTSPIADEIIQIGSNISGTGVITGSDLADLAAQINATESSGDYVLNATPSQPFALTKRDVEFDVVLPDTESNSLETWNVTYVVFDGSLDAAYQGGADNAYYLPINWRATADAVLTISQSA